MFTYECERSYDTIKMTIKDIKLKKEDSFRLKILKDKKTLVFKHKKDGEAQKEVHKVTLLYGNQKLFLEKWEQSFHSGIAWLTFRVYDDKNEEKYEDYKNFNEDFFVLKDKGIFEYFDREFCLRVVVYAYHNEQQIGFLSTDVFPTNDTDEDLMTFSEDLHRKIKNRFTGSFCGYFDNEDALIISSENDIQ